MILPASPEQGGYAPTAAVSKKLRPAGGSFDFMGGSYKQSRRKARQRFIAILAGTSVFALTAIFTAYTVAASNQMSASVDEASAAFATTRLQFEKATGQKAETRSQLQSQLTAAAASLSLAAASSVDVATLVPAILKILPNGAAVKKVTVLSWTDPAVKTGSTTPSPTPSAGSTGKPAAPIQKYSVTIVVSLSADQVSVFEANAAALPFYASQTSSTTRSSDGLAESVLTVTSLKPFSSPALQGLAGVK